MQQSLRVSDSPVTIRPTRALQPWNYERFVAEVVRCMDRCVAYAATGTLRHVLEEHLATGGKRVRVTLIYDLAVAMGVNPADCVEVAAACELLHNATLIHDDLQDRDKTRRGKPTVWAQHGDDQAINAGDIMLMLPFTALAEAKLPPAVRVALVRTLSVRAAATACGQSAEQLMLSQLKLAWDDWREAAAGKTGQIFAIPFEAIALLTGVAPAAARRVGDVATGLGVVFQAADDVLDLYGDKGRERPGNDLREGRVTALVTAHLGENTDDERALIGLLAQPRQTTTDEQVQLWADRFVQRGTLTQIQQQVTEEIDALRRITVPECAELSSCMVNMATRLATPLHRLCDAAKGARSEM